MLVSDERYQKGSALLCLISHKFFITTELSFSSFYILKDWSAQIWYTFKLLECRDPSKISDRKKLREAINLRVSKAAVSLET